MSKDRVCGNTYWLKRHVSDDIWYRIWARNANRALSCSGRESIFWGELSWEGKICNDFSIFFLIFTRGISPLFIGCFNLEDVLKKIHYLYFPAGRLFFTFYCRRNIIAFYTSIASAIATTLIKVSKYNATSRCCFRSSIWMLIGSIMSNFRPTIDTWRDD